jgi:hypothetical protein
MEALGIVTVVSITAICYLVGMIVKATPWNNNQLIPIVCGFAGGVLGIVGMFIIPDFPATDYLNAAAVGIASGLAATGIDQISKQLLNGSDL